MTEVGLTDWLKMKPFAELAFELRAGNGQGGNTARLSLGDKLAFWPSETIELALGADIRIADSRSQDRGFASMPPWEAFAHLVGRANPWELTAPSPALATFVISGQVVDGATGAPLPKASVRVSGFEATVIAMNPNGRFNTWPLVAVDAGTLKLAIEAPGYYSEVQEIRVGEPESTRDLIIKLKGLANDIPGEVSGRVIDATNGNPLKSLVFIPALDQRIVTDPDGNFRVALRPGHYEILITARGYDTQIKKVEVDPGAAVILNVDMAPARKTGGKD